MIPVVFAFTTGALVVFAFTTGAPLVAPNDAERATVADRITSVTLSDYPGSNNAFKVRMLLMALGVPFEVEWIDIFDQHAYMVPRVRVETAEPIFEGRDEVHVDGGGATFLSSESFFEAMNALLLGAAAGPVPLGANDAAQIHAVLHTPAGCRAAKGAKTLDALSNQRISSYRGVVEYTGAQALAWEAYAVKNAQAWGTRLGARLGAALLRALRGAHGSAYTSAKAALMSSIGIGLDSSKRGLCCLVGELGFQALAEEEAVTPADVFLWGSLAILERRYYRRLFLPAIAARGDDAAAAADDDDDARVATDGAGGAAAALTLYAESTHGAGCTDAKVHAVLVPWVDKMMTWQRELCATDAAAAAPARCRFWSGMGQEDAALLLGGAEAVFGDWLPAADRGIDARGERGRPWTDLDDARARKFDVAELSGATWDELRELLLQ